MNKVLPFPNPGLGDSRSTNNTRARLRPGNLQPNRKSRRAETTAEPGIRPDSALLIRIALLQAVGRRPNMTDATARSLSPPVVDAAVIRGLVDLAERGCPACQLVLRWLGATRITETTKSKEIAHD